MMLSKRLQQLSRKRGDDLPKISVTSFGDELEVNLKISESIGSINLPQVIHAIEEEGAEAISLSYSIVGGQLLGTIHSKVESILNCLIYRPYVLQDLDLNDLTFPRTSY